MMIVVRPSLVLLEPQIFLLVGKGWRALLLPIRSAHLGPEIANVSHCSTTTVTSVKRRSEKKETPHV